MILAVRARPQRADLPGTKVTSKLNIPTALFNTSRSVIKALAVTTNGASSNGSRKPICSSRQTDEASTEKILQ